MSNSLIAHKIIQQIRNKISFPKIFFQICQAVNLGVTEIYNGIRIVQTEINRQNNFTIILTNLFPGDVTAAFHQMTFCVKYRGLIQIIGSWIHGLTKKFKFLNQAKRNWRFFCDCKFEKKMLFLQDIFSNIWHDTQMASWHCF